MPSTATCSVLVIALLCVVVLLPSGDRLRFLLALTRARA